MASSVIPFLIVATLAVGSGVGLALVVPNETSQYKYFYDLSKDPKIRDDLPEAFRYTEEEIVILNTTCESCSIKSVSEQIKQVREQTPQLKLSVVTRHGDSNSSRYIELSESDFQMFNPVFLPRYYYLVDNSVFISNPSQSINSFLQGVKK